MQTEVISIDNNAGYPMAKNLRAKIPEGDSMTIFDVNKTAVERFVQEAGNVKAASTPREVVEQSVRHTKHSQHSYMMSHIVLSMILSWGLRSFFVISLQLKPIL